MSEPDLLTVPQVANRLGLSQKRVRKLLRQRALPGLRIGGTWHVPRVELDLFLVRLRGKARGNLSDLS
ncbi:MAG: helix-turn-helix domain-containing protein [Planctomycetota bacterium]|nr:helix-turn-helix domain-containing protein [Planctomycetota bacterium]